MARMTTANGASKSGEQPNASNHEGLCHDRLSDAVQLRMEKRRQEHGQGGKPQRLQNHGRHRSERAKVKAQPRFGRSRRRGHAAYSWQLHCWQGQVGDDVAADMRAVALLEGFLPR